MFGWFNEASVLASRSNLATRSGSCANASGNTLIATSRPRLISRARYTSPMPPAPIALMISYDPTRAPDVILMSFLKSRLPILDDCDRRRLIVDRDIHQESSIARYSVLCSGRVARY